MKFLKLSVCLLSMAIIYHACSPAEKQEVMITDDNGFNAIFFALGMNEIITDSPDTLQQEIKKMNGLEIFGADNFWSDHKNYFMYSMGNIEFPATSQYHFQLTLSGKIVLKINNKEVFKANKLVDTLMVGSQYVSAGKNIFEIEYFDGGLDPKIELKWSADGKIFESIPVDKLFHADGKQEIRPYVNPDYVISTTDTVIHNVLTEKEKAEGWSLLFDGASTKGWHRYNYLGEIGAKWHAQNGALVFDGRKRFRFIFEGRMVEFGRTNKLEDGGMDIVTDKAFGNFELHLEWNISEGGNSGIFYTVLEDAEFDEAWKTSPEMQVLDNQTNKDALIVSHQAGDLYDLIPSSEKVVKPFGEWNKVRIVKNQGQVEHWLNDVKVVTYDMNSPEWTELIKKSKFARLTKFAMPGPGQIALQDHDCMVLFRNIKIKEL